MTRIAAPLFAVIFSLFLTPFSFASDSDVDFGEDGASVTCEWLLKGQNAQTSGTKVAEAVFSRPFGLYFMHQMSKAGLSKLGLDSPQSELENLILTIEKTSERLITVNFHLYRDGGFDKVSTYAFEGSTLSRIAGITLNQEQEKYSYAQLIQDFPNPTHGSFLSYHSLPDKDGVRRFLTIETGFDSDHITFGLDVPMDQVRKYTPDVVEVIGDVRTPDGNFGRISVLSFHRSK